MLSIFGRTARLGTRATAVALMALILASCGSDNDVPVPPLFSTTVVFGASVTDNGNVCPAAAGCPPVPPYAPGRYTNGVNYAEVVAARYGATLTPSTRPGGGNNFAYAGARTGAIPGLTTQSTTPSMIAQLDQYTATQRGLLSDRALYILDATTFGNNINAGLPLVSAGTITGEQLVTAGITDIVTMVTRLYAIGARHVVVVNAPNIGLTPLVQAAGAAAVGGATQLSGGFAQNLAATLAAQRAGWPGLNLYQLDLFTLSNQITANPAGFGLTNVTQPCFSVAGTTVNVCAQPDSYLYWDSFHPTRAANAQIAQRINALLPAPQ